MCLTVGVLKARVEGGAQVGMSAPGVLLEGTPTAMARRIGPISSPR